MLQVGKTNTIAAATEGRGSGTAPWNCQEDPVGSKLDVKGTHTHPEVGRVLASDSPLLTVLISPLQLSLTYVAPLPRLY